MTTTGSLYANLSTEERNGWARARRLRVDAATVEEPFDSSLSYNEVPKCAAFFDHSAGCDLRSSHICGPSELSLAIGAMYREAYGKAAR
jgi:hypothetical protein